MPLLLLDLDDTLVDRQAIFAKWVSALATDIGLREDECRWITELDARGRTDRTVFFQSLIHRLKLTGPAELLVERWQNEFPAHYRCTPNVIAALVEARAQGWRLGAVTNGHAQVQERKLRAAGLLELLDAVCISGAEGIRKPERRIFELAAERAGAPLAGGWMVGDNASADIRGARDVGLSTVWITDGEPWSEPDFAPDLTATDVAQAIELLLAETPGAD